MHPFIRFMDSSLARKVLIESILAARHTQKITRNAFMDLCTKGEQVPIRWRMNAQEAESYLVSLQRSGKVSVSATGIINLCPENDLNSVLLRAGLPTLANSIPSVEKRQKEIDRLIQQRKDKSSAQIHKAQLKRKNFWGATVLLSGAQMTILSYLTFVIYGWDVMEPICYFVTSATALSSFGYFLYFRRENTFDCIDDNLLPHLVSRDMAGCTDYLLRCAAIEQEMKMVASSESASIIQQHRSDLEAQ